MTQNTEIKGMKETLDNFTDREDIINNFWDKLHKIETGKEPYYIFTYGGNGGIGKSELLKKLERELNDLEKRRNETRKKAIEKDGKTFKKRYIPVRFDFETTTDIVGVLTHLRAIISGESDMKFPIFDYAVARYEELMFQETGAKRRTSSLYETTSVVSKIASIYLGVDVIDSVKTINDALKKIAEKANSQLKKIYKTIDSQTVDGIRQYIEQYFALDMDSKINETRNRDCFVFLLDTFELLQYEEKYETKQKLLRMICVEKTDKVMWVLAGRNDIKIDDPHHENIVVGNFEKKHAIEYLKKREITEKAVAERIYEISDGSPLFLQIGADTYNNMSAAERKNAAKSMYGIDREELIKRYMKYLSDGDQLVLYMMSSMMHWKREDFKAVFNAVHNNSWSQYIRNFNRVNETHMIERISEDESRYLHRVVRNSIYTDPQYPDENKENTFDAILNLYKERITGNLKELELSYYKERIIEILKRAVQIKEPLSEKHEKMVLRMISNSSYDLKGYGYEHINGYIDALEEYESITNEPEKVERAITNLLGIIRKDREVITRLETVLKSRIEEFGEDSVELIPSLRKLAREYYWNKEFEKAIDVLNRWRRIVMNNQSSGLLDSFNVDLELMRVYKQVGEMSKAKELKGSILDTIEKRVKNGISDEKEKRKVDGALREIYFYSNKNERERIIHIREDFLIYIKKEYGENSVEAVREMSRLHRVLWSSKRLDDEQKVLDEIELIAYKKEGAYDDVLEKLRILREVYRRNSIRKSTAKSEEITKVILEFIEKNKPEDFEDIIYERGNLQDYLFDANKIEEAFKLYEGTLKLAEDYYSEKPEDIYRIKSGIIGNLDGENLKEIKTSIIKELEEFLMSYSWQDKEWLAYRFRNLADNAIKIDSKNAIRLMEKAVEVIKEQYGEKHERVFDYQENLVGIYEEIGEKEKSRVLFEEIITNRLELVKDNEEAYIDELRKIANKLWYKGEADSAEEKYKEVIEKCKAFYGPNDVKTRELMLKVARKYSSNDAYIQKAIFIYEEVLSMDDKENVISKKEKLDICNNLSSCYSNVGHVEEAITTLDSALKEYIEVAGEGNRMALRETEELAELLNKVGRAEEAIERLEKEINNYRLNNEEDNSLISALETLADIYSSFDKEKEKELRDEVERIRANRNRIRGYFIN